MHDLITNELNKLGVFKPLNNPFITAISNSIPNTIPTRMKQTIAISELIRFVSQFRIHIKCWNNSLIPINSISFCVAKSGLGKDSSVTSCRKCFKSSYDLIEQSRIESAKERAIELAKENNVSNPSSWQSYKQFYEAPSPLVVGISTVEGFLQYLSDLSNDSLSAGSIFTGEFGGELASNSNISEIIKAISELYDEGNKELKVLKDKTKQTAVNNIAVSALFMGSPDNLLYDEVIKRKFKMEFSSKLARRSTFIYINENVEATKLNTIEAILEHDRLQEEESLKNREMVSSYVEEELFYFLKEYNNTLLNISNEVVNLFNLYKRYNAEEEHFIGYQFPISKITRRHLQWKAFKLSGALALAEMSTTIELKHYIDAIRFLESTFNDIINFEKELTKEPYEVFVTHIKEIANNNLTTLSLHDLRKLGYISLRGNPTTKMKELVQLASSYDADGSYRIEDDSIVYSPITKVDDILISYVDVKGTKQQRAGTCASGYVTETIKFEDLLNVLQHDLAYASFRFKNGIRGTDNINSTCKWIILDVDDTTMSDKEAHLMLSDIKHIISRTANKDNEFKYRVIIELDAEIDVPDRLWGIFISNIATSLGITADKLPKAQVYFSYKDSHSSILYNFEAEPLPVKAYLDSLQDVTQASVTELSKNKQKSLLKDPLSTFMYAFNATKGNRSRNLIRAAKHAKDLGASREEVLQLMLDINDNYWVNPLHPNRFENTIIIPIRDRWVW